RMLPRLDFPRALLRGRYMAAAARMEWNGVPIDVEALDRLRRGWDRIKGRLIAAVDRYYGVFLPAGQRIINPQTLLGAAILAEAEASGIDPHRLADAVDAVWAEEREVTAEIFGARRAARRLTSLTARRINQWEDSGRDHTQYPHLDETARDLAGGYPALGIDGLHVGQDGPDDADYASRLWEVLRSGNERPKPKHHPDIVRRAAEQVAACPDTGKGYCGPMTFSAERWGGYLARNGIPWPRLASGALALDDDTFREMSRAYPDEVGPIR